jgi:hypothetical protein
MLLRLLLISVLSLSLAAPAAEATPDAAKKKCKKGYVLKTVKTGKGKKARRVKKCVKKKKAKAPAPQAPVVGTPPPVTPPPGTPAPVSPQSQAPPADQIQKTRDDEAGRQAMNSMGGPLMLERAEFGNVTATYNRMWFTADGQFQWYTIDWMQEMGEKCSATRRGTWSLKEGGRFTSSKGNGTYVIVSLSFNGQNGDELLVFGDAEPNNVYISPKGLKFEKNPNMRDSC